jgi:TolB protein
VARIAVSLALLVLALPGQALATFPGTNGLIAFVSTRDVQGDAEIWVMAPDGTGQMQLTDNALDDFDPVWSPDGGRVAFCSNRDSPDSVEFDIYAMDADGSNVVRLTAQPANECDLAWAPGGTRIVFSSSRSGNAELYVMAADGSSVKRLTSTAADETSPDWSPSGKWIAYVRNGDIWKMRPDGSRRTKVAGGRLSVSWNPSWSPGSAWIAFEDDRDTGERPTSEIWIVLPDGTASKRLTRNRVDDFQPAWSPDGKLIAFASGRGGGLDHIWTVRRDGSRPRQLTATDEGFAPGDFMPDWQRRSPLPA